MRIFYRLLARAIVSPQKQLRNYTRGYAHLTPTLFQINTTGQSLAKMEDNITTSETPSNTPNVLVPTKKKRKKKNKKGTKVAPASTSDDPNPPKSPKSPEPTSKPVQQQGHPKFALESPQRPVPTPLYVQRASLPPSVLPNNFQPLLIILDLNGTVIHRQKSTYPPRFQRREGSAQFLKVLMKEYKVMVWSSAQKSNVTAMVDKIFGEKHRQELITVWDRSYLGLSKADFYEKVQVYKQLEQVWADSHIAASHPWKDHGWIWDQSNTVLIDDTFEKAASEPHNLLEIPTFEGKVENKNILDAVLKYLRVLQHQRNVSSYMRAQPFRFPAKE